MWFKKTEDKTEDIKIVEPAKAAPVKDAWAEEASYTIGVNGKGATQMRVQLNGWGSTTLTLNPEAVVLLIKQLAVTIDEKYGVEIYKIDEQGPADENPTNN